jgi:Mrp family chromosome partitioning ATPase
MKFRLPFKKDLSKKSRSQVTVNNKNKFAIVESYKIARTNIMFSLSASEKKAFAVTSYSKGEGKSTVASNLAISFSKMESKVLLIDCDLRRPNVHNIFKIDNTKGLADVIGKMINFDQAVQKNVLPGLDILVSGTIPPNPYLFPLHIQQQVPHILFRGLLCYNSHNSFCFLLKFKLQKIQNITVIL